MRAYFIWSVFSFSISLAFKSISFIAWYPESPMLAVEFIFAQLMWIEVSIALRKEWEIV